MTYADMFSKVKGLFMESDVSDISEHPCFSVQYNRRGRGNFLCRGKGWCVGSGAV